MKIAKKAGAVLRENMKKNTFLTGALVLAVAGIVCRLLGVLFRIPLANIVKIEGMGIYQMVFPLYSLLLVISSAGVPVAISKMVAREKTKDDMAACKKILINALVLLGIIGIAVSVLFVVSAKGIATVQDHKDAWIIYLAIAPSVFIVCLIAAFRGYFQGLQNMVPTAVSQIIEQVVKIGAGITLALILIKISTLMAVFGAILAVTVSEVIAFGFLMIVFIRSQRKEKRQKKTARSGENKKKQIVAGEQIAAAVAENEQIDGKRKLLPEGKELAKIKGEFKANLDKKLMWSILKQSVPITLMSLIFPLILVFDSLVVIRLLERGGANHSEALQLFGISSGIVHTLINLPAVLGVAIGTAVVPTVSSLLKQEKGEEMKTKCALAVKLIFLVSLFFTVFYLFFSGHILKFLYNNAFRGQQANFRLASNLLKLESILIIFMGLTSVFSSMLQGIDKAKFPLISLAIGGAAKIIFELLFISGKMGVYAVSFANIICFGIAALANTFFALKYIKLQPKLVRVLLKSVFLIAVYVAALWVMQTFIPEGGWWVILAGAAAVAVFGAAVLLFRFFNKHEKDVFSKIKIS